MDGVVNADATEERKSFLNFTEPYATYPSGLVTLKTAVHVESLGDMGAEVICAKNNSSHLQLLRDKTNVRIYPIETLEQGFEQVIKGDAFGVFDDVSVMGHLISKYNFVNLKINFIHYDEVVGVARLGLRNDDPILLSVLNKAILSMTKKEKDDIQSLWITQLKPTTVVERRFDWTLFLKFSIPVVLVFILSSVLVLFHNRRLQHVVTERTSDLQESKQQLERDQMRSLYLLQLVQTRWESEDELSKAALEMCVNLTNSEAGYLLFVNPGNDDTVHFHSWSKDSMELFTVKEKPHYPFKKAGIWAKSVQTGKPAVHNTEPQDGWQYPKGHFTLKRHMCIPVFESGDCENKHPAAVIGVGNKETAYTDDDVEQLEIFMNSVWGVFRQRRTEADAKQQEKRLKEAETQLRQAQKLESIGTLAGGIAHDFNNILSIIMGYGEIIQSRVDSQGPNYYDLGQILKAGHRATELVQQILAFSRQAEKELQPLQPHLIVKEALKMLRASLPATIEIRQNVNNCGTILADHTQLHQIVMNLCTNAYYAMRETGGILGVKLDQIEIKAEDLKVATLKLAPGTYIRLEISDSGMGISKAILAKIFDPYFTTKEKGEGTGLGLSIVHGIIKFYGGDITVYSEVGEGTTFCVYLPKIESESALTLILPSRCSEDNWRKPFESYWIKPKLDMETYSCLDGYLM